MWRQGGGEGDPNRVHDFLAFLSFSQQWGTTLESLGGADPFGSFPEGSAGWTHCPSRVPQGMLLSEWGLHGTGALPTLWILVVGIEEVVNEDNSSTGCRGN